MDLVDRKCNCTDFNWKNCLARTLSGSKGKAGKEGDEMITQIKIIVCGSRWFLRIQSKGKTLSFASEYGYYASPGSARRAARRVAKDLGISCEVKW